MDTCGAGHQRWGDGAVERLNPNVTFRHTKNMVRGDSHCEWVVERKKSWQKDGPSRCSFKGDLSGSPFAFPIVRNGIGNSLAGAKAQGLRAERDIAGTNPPNGVTQRHSGEVPRRVVTCLVWLDFVVPGAGIEPARPSGGDHSSDVESLSVSIGVPQVVLNLLVQPTLGGGTEGDGQTCGHLRGYARATVLDGRQGLPAHAEREGDSPVTADGHSPRAFPRTM